MKVCSGKLTATLAVIALALAGCGGKGDDGNAVQLKGPSADKVAAGFGKASGAPLVREGADTPDWTLLSLPKGTDRYDQYGVFSVYVVKTKHGRDILLSNHGKPLQREGNLYWDQGDSGGYSVTQQFGDNVLLVWQAGDERKIDDKYKGLAHAVQAAVDGKTTAIPTAEQQCQQAGIDPAKGPKEGSCRLGAMKLTVVNGTSKLQTPVLAARVKGVSTTAQITPESEFLDPKRARGRFVVIDYELENTGDQPIEYVREKFILDGKTYSADDKVSFDLNPKNPLPLQPGMSATIHTAFDVPPDAADRAREGALALPAARFDQGSSSLDDEAAQGWIRLADAPTAAPSGATGARAASRAQRRVTRQQNAVRAVKQFFTAVRRRDAPSVCTRITDGQLKRFGGLDSCRRGAVVRDAYAAKLPRSNRGLRFTATVTGARATVFIAGRRFTGLVGLVKQGDTWRVNRVAGRKHRASGSSGGGSRS
jgi:hypothetical protein